MTERDARIGRAVGWTAALLFGVAVGGSFGYHSSAGREQGGTIGLLTEAAGGFLMVGFVAVVLVIDALASRSEDSRDLGPASLLVALATVIGFPVVPFVVEHLEWGYAAPLFRTAHALATVRLTGTDAFTGEATLSGTCTAPGKTGAVEMVETDAADDHVILDEYQRGYNFKSRLLRPSMVKVAVNPSSDKGGNG